MIYNILISSAAFEDIKEARNWYEEHRLGLSFDFDLCLEGGYEDIRKNPTNYQIKFKNIRVKYISRFPFGIHYFIEGDVVYVVGVFHTSKSPKRWRL